MRQIVDQPVEGPQFCSHQWMPWRCWLTLASRARPQESRRQLRSLAKAIDNFPLGPIRSVDYVHYDLWTCLLWKWIRRFFAGRSFPQSHFPAEILSWCHTHWLARDEDFAYLKKLMLVHNTNVGAVVVKEGNPSMQMPRMWKSQMFHDMTFVGVVRRRSLRACPEAWTT